VQGLAAFLLFIQVGIAHLQLNDLSAQEMNTNTHFK